MGSRIRVTYATLSADNEDLHTAFEEGLQVAKSWLGATIPARVGTAERTSGPTFDVTSPGDLSVRLCTAHEATATDVDDAVAAAAASNWRHTPWPERVAVLRRAADLISDRSAELAALMSMEVGKNRLEALGDVEESAVFFRYYGAQVEENNGFDRPMERLSDAEITSSVLRPYGVWAVIVPFNYPMALAAGPTAAALVAGNTVLIKPSPQGTFSAAKLHECLLEAGVPADAVHLLPGGDDVGKQLVGHPGVDGLTFTGSYEVGMQIERSFSTDFPKPLVAEMGGKNPTVVSRHADVAAAALGVARSAFGLSGQKCSACSRVYVERAVHEEFLEALADRAEALVVGEPTARNTYLGPVIDAGAVQRFTDAVEHARKHGRVVTGGAASPAGEGRPEGYYLQPTVVADLPADDRLFTDELFVPLVTVAPVDSLDEAIALANGSHLGLTAGFFSADDSEVDKFLDAVEAGVVYVNRPAGATTGAWPGVQPFGGWKGSGSAGKAGGGLYYVQQYLREQSRTVVTQ